MTPDSHLDVPIGGEAIRRGLDDFMWMEILSRLSSTNHVFQCKCVSKRWNSLISDRYFIRRFIDHHLEKYGSDFNAELLLFFHYYSLNNKDGMGILTCSSDHKGIKQEDLSSLSTYKVESSYNDLLVFSKMRSLTYYIVNPFTKKHVELPKYDSDCLYHAVVGFVCEPFYRHGGKQFDPLTNYRYRVVRIIDSNKFGDCRIEIYCSEKKQWSLLTGLDRFRYGCVSNVVAHGGNLYWYSFNNEVVAFDPFIASDEPGFKFLELNETQALFDTRYFQLARSQGSLLLMQLATHNQASYMSIWKLEEAAAKNGDREAFRFECTVTINDIMYDTSPNSIRRVVDNDNTLLVLGVHPSNRDVIFLGYDKSPHVASYNLVTKEWQKVGEIEHIDDIRFLIHKFGISANLPWWPTPVH